MPLGIISLNFKVIAVNKANVNLKVIKIRARLG